MGFFDFLFGGGVPSKYRRVVRVFSPEVPMSDSEATAKGKLKMVAERLSKGTEQEQKAGKALYAFINKGGAKYFVKKQ